MRTHISLLVLVSLEDEQESDEHVDGGTSRFDVTQYTYNATQYSEYNNQVVLAFRSRGSYVGQTLTYEVTGNTQFEITADEWSHKYSRQEAAFPLEYVKGNKFWPSVNRVNNTHGDRYLICTCEPVSAYASAT